MQHRTKPCFNKCPWHGQSIVHLNISSPAICMTAHTPLVPNFRPMRRKTLPAGVLNWLLHLKWQMVSWWKPIYLLLVINTCNKSNNTSSLSSHRFPRTGSCLWSMAFQYITVCSGPCRNRAAVRIIYCRGAALLWTEEESILHSWLNVTKCKHLFQSSFEW